jgi:hypothetical protein
MSALSYDTPNHLPCSTLFALVQSHAAIVSIAVMVTFTHSRRVDSETPTSRSFGVLWPKFEHTRIDTQDRLGVEFADTAYVWSKALTTSGLNAESASRFSRKTTVVRVAIDNTHPLGQTRNTRRPRYRTGRARLQPEQHPSIGQDRDTGSLAFASPHDLQLMGLERGTSYCISTQRSDSDP